MKEHNFLWVDLETTGLDPYNGRILEFAVVLCEDGDDFDVVEHISGVIHYPDEELKGLDISDAALDMHFRNGLWLEVQAAGTALMEADDYLAEFASENTRGKKQGIMLAGSCVYFDKAWIQVHMPRFATYLSHRVLDVRTLMTACELWTGRRPGWTPRQTHRALPDILATIADAKIARDALTSF